MKHYALKINITEENMETANFKLFAQFEFSEVISCVPASGDVTTIDVDFGHPLGASATASVSLRKKKYTETAIPKRRSIPTTGTIILDLGILF